MSEEKKITRRNFLRAAGLVGGAAAVAACAAPAPAPAATQAPAAAAPTTMSCTN
jgi:nitrous oxide reductase